MIRNSRFQVEEHQHEMLSNPGEISSFSEKGSVPGAAETGPSPPGWCLSGQWRLGVLS